MPNLEIASYDRNDCLLCRLDGKVVGQVNIRDLRDEFFGGYVIWNLLVYPPYRKQNIATELIACVLCTYDDAPIFINADPFHDDNGLDQAALISWYEKLGFTTWHDEKLNPDRRWLIFDRDD
jgi:GNAT superfamily N-acetyltransferase